MPEPNDSAIQRRGDDALGEITRELAAGTGLRFTTEGCRRGRRMGSGRKTASWGAADRPPVGMENRPKAGKGV